MIFVDIKAVMPRLAQPTRQIILQIVVAKQIASVAHDYRSVAAMNAWHRPLHARGRTVQVLSLIGIARVRLSMPEATHPASGDERTTIGDQHSGGANPLDTVFWAQSVCPDFGEQPDQK